MKWPESVTLIRHGETAYTELVKAKKADPEYQDLVAAYNNREQDPEAAIEIAQRFMTYGKYLLSVGDHDTPLTDFGWWQNEETGKVMRETRPLPHVVFVSPYGRTKDSLAGLVRGWPELGDVKVIEDDRIREQERGLALLYNDWRIFHILHPEQGKLWKMQGKYWYRFPQGENIPDVRERNRSHTTTLVRDFREKRVLEVTHHLNILSVLANHLKYDAEEFDRMDEEEKPLTCGVTDFVGDPTQGEDGKLILKSYNKRLYKEPIA